MREENIKSNKQALNDGAKVDAKEAFGVTTLHLAAGAGHKKIVELLIANGADVNAKGSDDMTP